MFMKSDQRRLWLRLLVALQVVAFTTCGESSTPAPTLTTTTMTTTTSSPATTDDETNVFSPKLVKTYRRLPSYFIKMTPHFDNTTDTDVTATVGRDVFLPCSVRHLGDRTVSWIRRPRQGIFNVLAVGRSPYTADGKFQPMHLDNSESWNLQIKDVRPEDAGVYECQVSTSPKISRHVTLSVIESRARILGSPVLYVNQGGVLRLVCELSGPLTSKEFIFWYRNGRVLNYDTELKNRMEISTSSSTFGDDDRKRKNERVDKNINGLRAADAKQFTIGKKLESRLAVIAIGASDSGNYTCQPSNALSDSIQVFVIINRTVFERGQIVSNGVMTISQLLNPNCTALGAHESYDLPAAMQDSVMEISSATGNNVPSHKAIVFALIATTLPSILQYFFVTR